MIPEAGDGEARNLQDKAVRGSIWTSMHTVASTPVALAATVVVARTLGPAGFGTYALLFVAFTLAFTATNFGVNFAAIQWCASAEATKDRTLSQAIISRILRFRLLVQWPLLAVGGLIVLRGTDWPVRLTYVVAIGAYVVFLGGSVALFSENRTAVGAKLAFVASLFTHGLVIATALAVRSAEAVWVSRIVGMAVGELLTLLFLDKDMRCSVLQLRRTCRLPAGFMAFSRKLWVAGLLAAIVYSRSEVFVMRAAGQVAQVGIFALAFGISYQITAPVDSLLGPLLPASAALVAAHPELARTALLRGLRFSSLLSGLVYACLVPATYFAIPYVYGASFDDAGVAFLFLAAISAMQSVCHPLAAMITGRRGGGVLVRANLAGVGADLALALALIPHFKIAGAVVANAVGQGVSLAILVLDEKRQQGLSARELIAATQAWFRAPVAAGAAIAVGHAVGSRFFFGADVLVALAVASLVYLVLLRLRICPLTAGDREALLRSVPVRLGRVVAWLLRLLPVAERHSVLGPA